MHKGKKNVVETSSGIYSHCTFKLVHPYLDDPKEFFEMKGASNCCITIKQSATKEKKDKAKYTIDMFELDGTSLTEERLKETLMDNLTEEQKQQILSISDYHI